MKSIAAVLVTALAVVACTAEDAPDTPLAATEMPLTGPPGTWQTVAASRGASWIFYDHADLSNTAWRSADIEPDGEGSAPLGYGEPDVVTTVSYGPDPAHKRIATGFVRGLVIPRGTTVRKLYLRIRYDDGFVFYINGREGGRAHMPSGTITPSTLASSHEAGTHYEVYDISSQIPNLGKHAGDPSWNALAFEVHQASPSSSDLFFDAEVVAWVDGPLDVTTQEGIPRGSYWREWDRATAPGATWNQPGFADATWSAGEGPLGFGEEYLTTSIAAGPITSYFRKTFRVDGAVHSFIGDVMYDDGFVVYLNGHEIARSHMPAGPIGPSTLATGHEAYGAYETFDWTAAAKPYLVTGLNTLAVEVHQVSAGSSDLVFDLGVEIHSGWTRTLPPSWAPSLSRLALFDALHGIIVAAPSRVMRTSDGGATWTTEKVDYQDGGMVLVERLGSLHAWVTGFRSLMLATADQGATFTVSDVHNEIILFDLSFVDTLHGFAPSYVQDESGHIEMLLYRTSDGGVTWEASPTGVSLEASAIAFADLQHGWVAGLEGGFNSPSDLAIYGTSDGGVTWTKQYGRPYLPEVGALEDMAILDANTVWVVGRASGELKLVTHDGGATWTEAPDTSNSKGGLYTVTFPDALHGWAAGERGSIIATSDGGATWHVQEIFKLGDPRYGYPDIHDIDFSDPLHGIAVDGWGYVWHTASGGE